MFAWFYGLSFFSPGVHLWKETVGFLLGFGFFPFKSSFTFMIHISLIFFFPGNLMKWTLILLGEEKGNAFLLRYYEWLKLPENNWLSIHLSLNWLVSQRLANTLKLYIHFAGVTLVFICALHNTHNFAM